jgi:tRNA nucleotidyltransferase/poly(A) polymerase
MNLMRKAAINVAEKICDAGFEVLFAGGCVRDKLLGKEPKDYDLATSASPNEILRLFPKSNAVGAHFGVVIVHHQGTHHEVATFRTDGSYGDGRRPDSVVFSTAKEDAERRDFTINGLFENPFTEEIIDYVGGRSDLENKILRAIGDPYLRFEEDGLRLMRAVRFAARLDFLIEENTWRGMQENALKLANISPERIRDEFSQIITLPKRRRGLELLVDSRLITHFMPEVLALIGCEQPPQWHPEGDVYNHTRIMLEMLEKDAPLHLCLAVLLHDIAKPPTQKYDAVAGRIRFNGHDSIGAEMAEIILKRLRYSNDTINAVVPMVARHMQFMNVQQMRVAKLKRFMATPTFTGELELHRVDCASSNGLTDNFYFLLEKREEFSNLPLIPTPLVNGRDLIKAGLQPSPLFSEILEEIQTQQLEGKIQTREDALILMNQLKEVAL